MWLKICCTQKVLFLISAALVVVLVGCIILDLIGVPVLIDNQIARSVRLENDTIQWDRFIELPILIGLKIYLFQVKNPNEVLNKKATPEIEEIGPYVYEEKRMKTILGIDENEDSVTFEQTLNITFNQEASGELRESDLVTIVNPALLSLTQIITPLERFVVMGCLDKLFPAPYNKLFITTTVETLVLKGYEFAIKDENIGAACNIVRTKLIQKTKIMKNVERVYNDKGEIIFLRFAFLQFKIREPDGVYTTLRGIKDISELGSIIRWNSSPRLRIWGRSESVNNDTCQLIRGTDSTLYPPHVNQEGKLEIFSTDICRTVAITYKRQDSYKGVVGYRFGIDENTLRSENPEHDCYCTKQISDEFGTPSCFLDGLLDVMPCFGAPVLLSFPHFLYADERYINGINGMTAPNKSIHELFLLVEPKSGTPLEGMKRVQLNMVLRPIKYISMTENLPQTILPLLWIEEGVSLTQDLIDELNGKLFDVLKIVYGVVYAFIALVAAGLLITSGILIRKRYFTNIK